MKLRTTSGTATLTLDDGRTFTTTSVDDVDVELAPPPLCETQWAGLTCVPAAIKTAPDGWRECKSCGVSGDAGTILVCRRTGGLPK